MVYRDLPESCQKEIDNEVGKGELTSYEGFMDFVIHMSRHARYKKQSAPKPLTANLVSEDQGRSSNSLGSEPIYSVDEWVEWAQAPEGQQALHDGYELPATPEAQHALLAVAKGKGKWSYKGGENRSTKGSDKGKGKGKGGKGKGKNNYPPRPFTGKCHNCDEVGHYARDCPRPQRQGIRTVEDSRQNQQWYPGSSNPSSSTVTLCVTESVFTGYRQNSISNLVTSNFTQTA